MGCVYHGRCELRLVQISSSSGRVILRGGHLSQLSHGSSGDQQIKNDGEDLHSDLMSLCLVTEPTPGEFVPAELCSVWVIKTIETKVAEGVKCATAVYGTPVIPSRNTRCRVPPPSCFEGCASVWPSLLKR